VRTEAVQPFDVAHDHLFDRCDVGPRFAFDTCARQHCAPHLQFVFAQVPVALDHRQPALGALLDRQERTAGLAAEAS